MNDLLSMEIFFPNELLSIISIDNSDNIIHLRTHNWNQLEFQMFHAWQEQAAKLRAGAITKEKYDISGVNNSSLISFAEFNLFNSSKIVFNSFLKDTSIKTAIFQ